VALKIEAGLTADGQLKVGLSILYCMRKNTPFQISTQYQTTILHLSILKLHSVFARIVLFLDLTLSFDFVVCMDVPQA